MKLSWTILTHQYTLIGRVVNQRGTEYNVSIVQLGGGIDDAIAHPAARWPPAMERHRLASYFRMKSPPPERGRRGRPTLRPPQFRLSTMLWVVAAIAVVLAAMKAMGPIGAFALLLLLLAILAHVAGNAIGTQLRSIGSMPNDEPPCPALPRFSRRPDSVPVPLGMRSAISRTMIACTISAAAVFGLLGGTFLTWFTGGANVPTIILATVSSSVLGGLLGFAGSSFAQVAGGAWIQARR